MHVGIFDFEYVKVIPGYSVHFSQNWAVTQKRLTVERNGRKLGLGGVCCMHMDPFNLEHIKAILDIIPCSFLKNRSS